MTPFTDDVPNTDFVVNYSTDVSKARVYRVRFTASYADYASVLPTSFTFDITIVDLCANPLSLTSIMVSSTDYTIT